MAHQPPTEIEREFYVTLEGKRREDGSLFISAPKYPAFSAVGESEDKAWEVALDLLSAHWKENYGKEVAFRYVQSYPTEEEEGIGDKIPAFVISETHAIA